MKSTKCAIIIPLYKDYLYDYEEISLKQCIKVLNANYTIYFVMPNNLDIFQILDKYDININGGEDYNYILYDPIYFSSLSQFNYFLTSSDIYEILKSNNYSYALLYELDGFVFYDNLKYWIDKEYDFIGGFGFMTSKNVNGESPFFLEKLKNDQYKNKFSINGGVSLRNINYCINTLQLMNGHELYGNMWEDLILSFNSKVDNKKPLSQETFDFCWSYNYELSYILNNYKFPMFIHYYQYNREMFNLCKNVYENNLNINQI